MQIFVSTIWENVTTSSADVPAGMEHLYMAGASIQYLKGPWGTAFSQFVVRKDYIFWLHYVNAVENNTTLFAAAAKDSLALLMMCRGALSGPFPLKNYQSGLSWVRGQSRGQWILPKGQTMIAEIDFDPAFEKTALAGRGSVVYMSRMAHLLLQKLPERFSSQSAPGLFLDGIAANLLHEHVGQIQQQNDNLLLNNPPFHFLQKDLDNIRAVKAHMDAFIDKRFSVRELASFAGTNRDMVNRGFKYVYGQTVHQYWLGISLTYAKELILNTSLTIRTVAAECGFTHYPHFIQQFRKHWGITPGEMRKTV